MVSRTDPDETASGATPTKLLPPALAPPGHRPPPPAPDGRAYWLPYPAWSRLLARPRSGWSRIWLYGLFRLSAAGVCARSVRDADAVGVSGTSRDPVCGLDSPGQYSLAPLGRAVRLHPDWLAY